MNHEQRAKMVETDKDIRTLRRIFKAFSSDVADYKRNKTYALESNLSNLKSSYTSLRKARRSRDSDPLKESKGFVKRTEIATRHAIAALLNNRKFNETVTVGGPNTGTAVYSPSRYRKPEVGIIVGYMWHRSVWQNMYVDERMVSKDYLILKATEYRTNVQHVRLYQVCAYGIAEKKMVDGWVGQSKLGKQLCAFRVDNKLAITTAQKLAIGAIDEQITREGE